MSGGGSLPRVRRTGEGSPVLRYGRFGFRWIASGRAGKKKALIALAVDLAQTETGSREIVDEGFGLSAWLVAIAGLSSAQRAEALAALTKAEAASPSQEVFEVTAAANAAIVRTRLARRALSASRAKGVRIAQVARSSAGADRMGSTLSLQELRPHVQRPNEDADGASSEEGEMGRSRPGHDRRQEPVEDRGIVRRSSDDGLPLAASVSPFAGGRQARTLSGIVEADETFVLGAFKGRRSDLPREARKRGGKARQPSVSCW